MNNYAKMYVIPENIWLARNGETCPLKKTISNRYSKMYLIPEHEWILLNAENSHVKEMMVSEQVQIRQLNNFEVRDGGNVYINNDENHAKEYQDPSNGYTSSDANSTTFSGDINTPNYNEKNDDYNTMSNGINDDVINRSNGINDDVINSENMQNRKMDEISNSGINIKNNIFPNEGNNQQQQQRPNIYVGSSSNQTPHYNLHQKFHGIEEEKKKEDLTFQNDEDDKKSKDHVENEDTIPMEIDEFDPNSNIPTNSQTRRRNTNFDTRYRENSNLQNNLQIEPSRIETANKFTNTHGLISTPSRIETANKFTNTHGLIRTNNKFIRTSGLIEKQDVHTNTENPIRNIEPNEERRIPEVALPNNAGLNTDVLRRLYLNDRKANIIEETKDRRLKTNLKRLGTNNLRPKHVSFRDDERQEEIKFEKRLPIEYHPIQYPPRLPVRDSSLPQPINNNNHIKRESKLKKEEQLQPQPINNNIHIKRESKVKKEEQLPMDQQVDINIKSEKPIKEEKFFKKESKTVDDRRNEMQLRRAENRSNRVMSNRINHSDANLATATQIKSSDDKSDIVSMQTQSSPIKFENAQDLKKQLKDRERMYVQKKERDSELKFNQERQKDKVKIESRRSNNRWDQLMLNRRKDEDSTERASKSDEGAHESPDTEAFEINDLDREEASTSVGNNAAFEGNELSDIEEGDNDEGDTDEGNLSNFRFIPQSTQRPNVATHVKKRNIWVPYNPSVRSRKKNIERERERTLAVEEVKAREGKVNPKSLKRTRESEPETLPKKTVKSIKRGIRKNFSNVHGTQRDGGDSRKRRLEKNDGVNVKLGKSKEPKEKKSRRKEPKDVKGKIKASRNIGSFRRYELPE